MDIGIPCQNNKNTPETIYELASCSKQFTAAAIGLLQRQGKLGYEDRLAKCIPELSFWKNVAIFTGISRYISLKTPAQNRYTVN